MSVDPCTLRRVARLARLAIDESALDGAAAQMQRVLDLAAVLSAPALDAVEPMAHPHGQTLAWRSDATQATPGAAALLALAPDARGGLYAVPKVIG